MATEFTERILDALGPAFMELAGPLLPDLVDGLTGPLSDIDALVAPTDRGWAAAFDVDATPQPTWLGQVVGTKVPAGLTLEEQRAYVRDRSRWKRGTPGAIRGAIRATLIGATRRVDLLEREGSPWRLKIRVWAPELPFLDISPVVAAAKSQTPVGIVVDSEVEVLAGASYEHLAEVHGTYEDVLLDFPTYDAPETTALTHHVPEEGTPI